MTRVEVVTDLTGIQKLIDVLSDPDDAISSAVRFAVRESSRPALNALQFVPGQSVHPFRWSLNAAANERARRWYLAAVSRGEIKTDGDRYARTGDMARAWDTGLIQESDGVVAVLRNESPKATYVYGNEDGTLEQIPGHERTGWPSFRPIGEEWVENTQAAFEERLAVEIEARL